MGRNTKTSAVGLLALAYRASAQVANICPSDDVCFGLNIPESTASSGTGDIFFQISAPSSYEYVSLGQGRAMANSNIFVVYTSADGNNVTLSPRITTSHRAPSFNDEAEVTLLEGSGVANGVMTANVRCSNCESWPGGTMSFTSDSGNWIYAYQSSGGPKNDDSNTASIRQHNNKGVFEWEFAEAKGGSSVNPLISNGTNATSTNSTSTSISSEEPDTRNHLIAHGVLASVAFVIFFPAGSIAIRLASFPGVLWFHAAFQIFAYMTYIAAFGLGIYLALPVSGGHYIESDHAIIGMVVFALIFFQPFLGFIHHVMFKKLNRRTLWSHAHIWVGRIAITLGIINGGLGLKLAGNSRDGEIAYGVVAGVMWCIWAASAVWGEMRRKKAVNAAAAQRPEKLTGERRESDNSRSEESDADLNGHYRPAKEQQV